MKKLIITGSSGMLGGNIVAELINKYDITGVYRAVGNPVLKNEYKLDLIKYDDTKRMVDRVKPDCVIHCAALSNIEACEKDYRLARDSNAITTKNMVSAIGKNTRMIYISTDSIVDGIKGNYTEDDIPHPLNNYTRTKLEGEGFVEQTSTNYVILRTNFFGWNLVNKNVSFIEWVYNSLREGEHIKMFTDIVFSPLAANTLSILIGRLINMEFAGRLNIGSIDSMSKYDFGVRFAELFGLDSSLIEPASIDKAAFLAKRPKNTSLNIEKAKRLLGPTPTVEEELQKFYEQHRRCCNEQRAVET